MLWNKQKKASDDPLLRQFRVTLETQLMGVIAQSTVQDALCQKMLYMLEHDGFTWDKANFIEQCLVTYYSDEKVVIETDRLLVQAKMIMDPEVAQFYADVDSKVMTPQCKKEMLVRILGDLQLESRKRVRRRASLHNICFKLVAYMLVLIVVMLLAGLHIFSNKAFFINIDECSFLSDVVVIRVLVLSFASGAIGASISMLMRFTQSFNSSRLRDMETFSSNVYLLNRMFIGAIGGFVGCYLVNSGTITALTQQKLFFLAECGGWVEVIPTAIAGITFGFWEFFLPTTLGTLRGGDKKQAVQR